MVSVRNNEEGYQKQYEELLKILFITVGYPLLLLITLLCTQLGCYGKMKVCGIAKFAFT